MRALGVWMFISKFIKLLGHYRRYPADFLLLPVSILFGYFHGAIKIYAAVTLNVVCYKQFNLLPSFPCFICLPVVQPSKINEGEGKSKAASCTSGLRALLLV